MAGKFAVSAFSSGPQDDYRTVDVYKQEGKEVLSSYTERRLNPPGEGLGSLFGGNPLTTLNLGTADAIRGAKTLTGFGTGIANADGIKGKVDRAVSSMGSIGSILNKASPGLQKSLMGSITGTQNVYATIGNTVARLKSGNLPDLRSVSGLINKVVGSDIIDISDKDSIIGMTAGLVQQASRGGFPTSFKALTKNLINDPTAIGNVIDKALPFITKSGDMGTLKEMVEIDPGAVKLSNPQILQDFSFNYQTPEGTTQVAKVELFSDVKDTFSKITPDWLTCTRQVANEGGVTVPSEAFDLSHISNASADFKDVMKIGALTSKNPDDKLFLIDTNPIAYLKEGEVKAAAPTVRDQLIKAFPTVALDQQTPSQPEVQTPSGLASEPVTLAYDEPSYVKGETIAVVKKTWPDGSYSEERTFKKHGFLRMKRLEIYDRKGNIIKKREEDLSWME
jgi:hypothetical protein